MANRQITVTYADPTGIWPRIETEFRKLFPLRNLSWLSLREQRRTIDSVNIHLEPFEAISPPATTPDLLLNRPFLNILFVQGEDLEAYRQTLRQQIKEWLDVIATRKPQEWLIVHVTEQETRNNTSKYLMMKTTVYDKLRTDFNTRRDRCIQIRATEKALTDPLWQELSNRMKEGIMGSFRQHVIYNEDDVRRLDAQRQMPGWNYCTFFLMKENMAQTYEMLGLHDEALMQYDELEASYFLVERESALAWFSSFGGKDLGDDSADIFDSKRKPYRTLIQDNSISLFDLQVYMFSRQCELLRQLNRAQELCNRAEEFITSMLRIIRQFRESLPDNFEEYWVFSACTRAVVKYYELVGEQGVDASVRKSIISLYYLARKQLDRLGIRYGLLPNKPPFSLNMDQTTKIETKSLDHMLSTITNAELAEAFKSTEDFDRLYLTLTENIADGYMELKQNRMAWPLLSDIASLDLCRGRAFKAIEAFHDLCDNYGNRGWPLIEGFLQSQLAVCRKELEQTDEYPFLFYFHLYAESTYAQLCLQLLQRPNTLCEEDRAMFTEDFIKHASHLKEATQSLAPMFKLNILDKTNDTEKIGIEISLDNTLIQPFTYDHITLTLNGENNERLLQLVTNEGTLEPGINTIILYCDHAETGDYTTKELVMTIGELEFKESFEADATKRKTFRISAPESSLTASLSLALSENADTATRFRIELFTRKHTIVKGEASLQISTDGVAFSTITDMEIHKTKSDQTTESIPISPVINEKVELICPLPSCDSNEICEWFIPFEHTRLTHKVKVKLLITYTTQDDQSFSFSVLETMDFSVPLSLRPVVYSLEKHTLVKVDIICDGAVPIRLLSCNATLSDGIRLLNEPPPSTYQSVLFAQSKTALTYRLDQAYSDTSANMTLQVRFRLLSDEAAIHVNALLEEALDTAGLSQYKWLVIEHTRSLLDNSVIDLNSIGLIDAISTEHLNASSYTPLFVHESESLQRRLNECLGNFFKEHRQIPIRQTILDDADTMDRSLFCNITLPNRQLITSAELIPACRELVIEESCACRIVVTQTRITPLDTSNEELIEPISTELCFDLDGGREQWIIAGQKKSRFTMQVRS
ncbi:hypothetical protein BDF22DRAFT_692769 [Syncephalis plumigaleata]|nr:hypothetical protein BDF22DRAFT_692769 [Syncephalis plumigaleata]